MKIIDYFVIGSRNLRRQPVRSILTIVAIAISATILLTLSSISIGMRQAITTTLNPDATLTRIAVTPGRTISGLSGVSTEGAIKKMDDHTVDALKKLPDMQAVAPVAAIWEIKSFTLEGTQTQFLAQAEGVETNAAARPALAAGEFFAESDDRHVVIVGQAYAKELGFAENPQDLVGKVVTFTTQNGYIGEGAQLPTPTANQAERQRFAETPAQLTAKVIGVTERGVDESKLLVPLQWAHNIRTHHRLVNGQIVTEDQITKEGYSQVLVKVDKPEDVQGAVSSIEALGFGTSSTLGQVNRLLEFSNIAWIGLGAVSLVALIAASIGIVNTMLMAVTEQRYSIGVLRACGATRATIMRLVLIEAAVLGCIGGLIGVAVSLAATSAVNQQLEHILAQQNVAAITIAVVPGWLLMGGVIVTVSFAVVSGLYPAYRAAKQDPSTILAGN